MKEQKHGLNVDKKSEKVPTNILVCTWLHTVYSRVRYVRYPCYCSARSTAHAGGTPVYIEPIIKWNFLTLWRTCNKQSLSWLFFYFVTSYAMKTAISVILGAGLFVAAAYNVTHGQYVSDTFYTPLAASTNNLGAVSGANYSGLILKVNRVLLKKYLSSGNVFGSYNLLRYVGINDYEDALRIRRQHMLYVTELVKTQFNNVRNDPSNRLLYLRDLLIRLEDHFDELHADLRPLVDPNKRTSFDREYLSLKVLIKSIIR